jgi:hypothetical protein
MPLLGLFDRQDDDILNPLFFGDGLPRKEINDSKYKSPIILLF